ncbi:MAG: triose-phosphate isomerase [Buchnera aphidicola (Periphyllus lyropictus)]|uniref:triose-phosphate isomerase n=1 Tax=Buchnera aphidicola TaxID=9 RepID=UPI001ED0AAA9|nr:triose-phosphate isomerase [Buchnera aphidicola]NIH16826.1 triose-phosphate isomerase [Buchnera aphidicola (Periphyllus lyropictus)]USS94508.1 triose-phosphate isomerase [Buchnera aphidicola (Periphyllus lyropictus)]
MKTPIIIANWKLNGHKLLVEKFSKKIKNIEKNFFKENTIILSPPVIYIQKMKEKIKNKKIFFAAQNVDFNNKGAFTGEISSYMINEIGAKYVILGHSERRKNHNEDNLCIAKKFKSVKKNNLIPILCIGETEQEKKDGLTKNILKNQINQIFLKCGLNSFHKTCIAYEPVWAIGTGKNASPILINKIMKFIKKYIIYKSKNKNTKIYLQYGGSVSTKNIKSIIKSKYVNGVLVGSGSLDYKNFFKIIKISYKIKKNLLK